MCLSVYQTVAELEQKWQNEVDEAHQGKLENNAPFFHDYHFYEVRDIHQIRTDMKTVPSPSRHLICTGN